MFTRAARECPSGDKNKQRPIACAFDYHLQGENETLPCTCVNPAAAKNQNNLVAAEGEVRHFNGGDEALRLEIGITLQLHESIMHTPMNYRLSPKKSPLLALCYSLLYVGIFEAEAFLLVNNFEDESEQEGSNT